MRCLLQRSTFSRRGLWGLVATVLLLLSVSLWYVLARRGYPSSFELEFSATGLVEQVDYQGERCSVKVAVYDWIHLSQGFELTEIPKRSDRYVLQGQGETCQALTVAMASTEQHIGFEAGQARGSWYFVDNPTAAVGCGGMEMNWKPDPEKS
ncbi:MAG: hypothetical protein ACRCYY_03990 [Trueperaceae bacterium]